MVPSDSKDLVTGIERESIEGETLEYTIDYDLKRGGLGGGNQVGGQINIVVEYTLTDE